MGNKFDGHDDASWKIPPNEVLEQRQLVVCLSFALVLCLFFSCSKKKEVTLHIIHSTSIEIILCKQ